MFISIQSFYYFTARQNVQVSSYPIGTGRSIRDLSGLLVHHQASLTAEDCLGGDVRHAKAAGPHLGSLTRTICHIQLMFILRH